MSNYNAQGPSSMPESIMKKPKVENEEKGKFTLYGSKVQFLSLNSTSNENLNGSDASRRDKYGNPINKKVKNHKISFSDQFKNERDFIQEKKVESFKPFNNSDDQEKKCMNCNIF